METIGTKPSKLNKHILTLSKWCIYSWIIITILMNVFVYREYNLVNIFMSVIIHSIIFIPIYLVLYTYVQNKNIKSRIIMSLISLIPLCAAFYFLSHNIPDLKFFSGLLLLFLVFHLMINFSVSVKEGWYLPLIINTFINTFALLTLVVIYKHEFGGLEEIIYSYNVSKILLLFESLLALLIAFAIHLYNCIIERRNENARNS